MDRLRELREAKGYSQQRLGMMVDAAQETISGYEVDRAEPGLAMLVKLADALGASIDYILGRTDVKALISTSELTEQETELLTTFRKLPSAKKERALGTLHGLLD